MAFSKLLGGHASDSGKDPASKKPDLQAETAKDNGGFIEAAKPVYKPAAADLQKPPEATAPSMPVSPTTAASGLTLEPMAYTPTEPTAPKPLPPAPVSPEAAPLDMSINEMPAPRHLHPLPPALTAGLKKLNASAIRSLKKA